MRSEEAIASSGEGLIAEPRSRAMTTIGIGHERLQRLMHRGTEFLGCDVAILGGAMTWVSRAQPRLGASPMPAASA